MKNRFALPIIGGAAAVTALVAAACAGPQSAGTAGGGGSMNIYLYQEPTGNFSPLAPSNGPDNQVMSLIDEGLLAVDPDYKLRPALAQSYDVSADAKTFTFHLRKGLKWSDGKPFTAQDVVFTYQLLADPKSTSATSGNYAGATFSAPDDDTFVITSAKPNYGLLGQSVLAYIMPKHVLGGVPVDKVAENGYFKHPTATLGPYKFVDYKTNQYVHVTRNPNYRTPAKIADIYLKPMTSDVATAQLGNGGIDVASFSPADLDTVKGFGKVDIQQAPGAGFIRIGLNQTKSYFADPRVRQAFLYAINRKDIVDKVLFGKATVRNSDFHNGNVAGLNDYAYDPEKAKQLLRQAHWDFNRTVELRWVPGQRDRDSTATIVGDQLGAVGVKVKLRQVQAAEVQDGYKTKSYDMLLFGGGNYAVDPWSVNVIAGCDQFFPNGGNITWFCDRRLDQLMTQANGTTDAAARAKLYDQAALEDNAKADMVWLYDPMGLYGVNKRVKGFQATGSLDAPFWNPAGWSLG